MRSILWFLLIFSATEGLPGGTRDLFLSTAEVPKLADDIYDKQKECDAYVGEEIVKAVEKDINIKNLEPKQEYLKCMKTLNEMKTQYITIVFDRFNSQLEKSFSMRLSDNRLVVLPTPTNGQPSEGGEGLTPKFDVQQELCMTNLLCRTISRLSIPSNDVEEKDEQEKAVQKCLDFLEDVKQEYIVGNGIKTREHNQKEMSITCREGAVKLPFPKNKRSNTIDTTMALENSKKDGVVPFNQSQESIPPKTVSSSLTSDNEKTNEDKQSEIFALADFIYKKQKECDSIVRETVVNFLVNYVPKIFPTPDERYIQCSKSLDENKRKYITTALIGLNYYSKMFPMVLSNKKFVTLPVAADETLSSEAGPEFDVQQELCITNQVCLDLGRKKFSNVNAEDMNGQEKNVTRCLSFLNDLKKKYINEKKIEPSELKARGLTVSCTEGDVTFYPPESRDEDTTLTSTNSDSSNTKSGSENQAKMDKDSTDIKPTHGSYKEQLDMDVIKSNDSQKPLVDDKSLPNKITADESVKEKSITNETFMAENSLSLKTKDVTTKSKINLESITNKSPSSGKTVEEVLTDNKTGKEEKIEGSPMGESENMQKVIKTSEGECTDNTSNIEETEVPTIKDEKGTKEKEEPEKEIDRKTNENQNVELVTYRVKFETKDGNGKVVKIQASGKIKKTEKENQSSPQPTSSSMNLGTQKDVFAGINYNEAQDKSLSQVNEPNKRKTSKSLEENITFMENDCKQLLLFGEILTKHKMLSSLVHLETQYDDCIKRLDTLKKLYIEKHKVDVSTHKNIFLLTIPSGEAKLVTLPKQFLKSESYESHSSLGPDDTFELEEYFRDTDRNENSNLKTRKPFDDPAFLSNNEFLRSLKPESPDPSALSKVASILHMSGNHKDKKIAE